MPFLLLYIAYYKLKLWLSTLNNIKELFSFLGFILPQLLLVLRDMGSRAWAIRAEPTYQPRAQGENPGYEVAYLHDQTVVLLFLVSLSVLRVHLADFSL
jgi:hypothetical protein